MLKDTALVVTGLLALQVSALPGWLGGSSNIEERDQGPPAPHYYGGGSSSGTVTKTAYETKYVPQYTTKYHTVYKPSTTTVQTCPNSTPVGPVIPSSTATIYKTSEFVRASFSLHIG